LELLQRTGLVDVSSSTPFCGDVEARVSPWVYEVFYTTIIIPPHSAIPVDNQSP